MPSTSLFQPWVKNVYSLGTDGVVTRAQSSTVTRTSLPKVTTERVKPQTFTHFFSTFTPPLYTRIVRSLSLLFTHLYTVSTAPTITKTKEK